MTSQKEATRAIADLTEAIEDVARAAADLTRASMFYMPARSAEPAQAAHYRSEAAKRLMRVLHIIGEDFEAGKEKASTTGLPDQRRQKLHRAANLPTTAARWSGSKPSSTRGISHDQTQA